MRFRKTALALAAGLAGVLLTAGACESLDPNTVRDTTAGQVAEDAAMQVASEAARASLQKTLETLNFQGVEVQLEKETDDTKAKPSPTPTARRGPKASPTPSTSASPTPKTRRTTKPSATPAGEYYLLSATLSVAGVNCRLNVEQKLDTTNVNVPKLVGQPEFDEVITPAEPGGIEVQGDARTKVNPTDMFVYVASNHPECVLSGATAPTR